MTRTGDATGTETVLTPTQIKLRVADAKLAAFFRKNLGRLPTPVKLVDLPSLKTSSSGEGGAAAASTTTTTTETKTAVAVSKQTKNASLTTIRAPSTPLVAKTTTPVDETKSGERPTLQAFRSVSPDVFPDSMLVSSLPQNVIGLRRFTVVPSSLPSSSPPTTSASTSSRRPHLERFNVNPSNFPLREVAVTDRPALKRFSLDVSTYPPPSSPLLSSSEFVVAKTDARFDSRLDAERRKYEHNRTVLTAIAGMRRERKKAAAQTSSPPRLVAFPPHLKRDAFPPPANYDVARYETALATKTKWVKLLRERRKFKHLEAVLKSLRAKMMIDPARRSQKV